jgi:acetylornithine deacetylase/succinyl-diaminopimelate desuccinylase-like protein
MRHAFALSLLLAIFSPAYALHHVAASPDSSTGVPNDYALARDIFRELIEIKTTYATGTTKAARAMAARLHEAGYPEQDLRVLGADSTKGNLVVRLHGSTHQKPILFIAHLDVVEARPEDWSLDPFTFVQRDGFFYGRGTTDCKSDAANLVFMMIKLRRQQFIPVRDIIVALTADEEAGGNTNGIQWLLANHPELIDAEYCINTDAGGGQSKGRSPISMDVQTSEKVYMSLQLEVRNRGGHSSLPVKDNAIYRLARALQHLAEFDFPLHLNETTRLFFERRAERETGQTAADMRAVAREPADSAAAARLSALSPYYNAQMRTTAVPTLLEAGHAENALPQTARATDNCRMLPDESPDEVQRTIQRVLDDTAIHISRLVEPKPSPLSPLRADLVNTVQKLASSMWPGALVLPVMSTGASDGVYLRNAGIPVYGVSGMFGDMNDVRAHGRDERIGVKEFYDGVKFMERFVKALTRNSGN